MTGDGRDFMGRVRGWWDRVAGDRDDDEMRGYDDDFMGASGPGAEGYFLSREMAREAQAGLQHGRRDWDDDLRSVPGPGGMAHFGRASRAGVFVNRRPGDDGPREGAYPRDPGTHGGMTGRGHRADYEGHGFAMGYDRDYGGGTERRTA